MTYDRGPKEFSPTVISHEENPKKKFLEDVMKKQKNRKGCMGGKRDVKKSERTSE